MPNEKITTSLYRQIAIDIAENIVNGKYTQGEKLFGRSVLASHYKVSPETIRKAVFLLKDVGVLETEKGSGIEIVSAEKAKGFLERNDNIKSLSDIKRELETWAKMQALQAADIMKKIEYIINETERIRVISPLNPFQIRVSAQCKVLNKTLDELRFWHNTGGTLIAIRRGDRLIVSPGPYAALFEDDCIFVVGDETAYSATMQFLFETGV